MQSPSGADDPAVTQTCDDIETGSNFHSGAGAADPDHSAANAASKIDGHEEDDAITPEQCRVRVCQAMALRCVSALYAVLTPPALWLSAGRSRPAVVWAFSLAACSLLFLWTIFLTSTLRARTVFLAVSYGLLAADAAAYLVSPGAGMAIALLADATAAGLLGYALAERRMLDGAERTHTAAPAPSSRTEEERKWDKQVRITVSFYASVMSTACAAGAAWVVARHGGVGGGVGDEDTYWLVAELSVLVCLGLWCWIAVVGLHSLHGALLTEGHMALLYLFGGTFWLPELLVSAVVGQAVGMLVQPLCMMALVAVFGYCLAVRAQYKALDRATVGDEYQPVATSETETVPLCENTTSFA